MTLGRGTVLHGRGVMAIHGIGTPGALRGAGRGVFMIHIGPGVLLGGRPGAGPGVGVRLGDPVGVMDGVRLGVLRGVARHTHGIL